jgi:hypothetical protein
VPVYLVDCSADGFCPAGAEHVNPRLRLELYILQQTWQRICKWLEGIHGHAFSCHLYIVAIDEAFQKVENIDV